MVKTIPRYIFLTSLAITIVIFVAGLLLGYGMDNFRTGDVLQDLKYSEVDTESYIVEQMFWESVDSGCGDVDLRIASVSKDLTKLGQLLSSYESKSLFSEEEFKYITRKYFIQEIKSYTMFRQLQEECNLNQDVILYFYDPQQQESASQGYVLDSVVNSMNNSVIVYSINANFEGENVIDTVKSYYNITMTPTLIVNGEEKVEGYQNYLDVLGLLE